MGKFIVIHHYGSVTADSDFDAAELQQRANEGRKEIDLYESNDVIGNVMLANGLPIGRKVGKVTHLQTFFPQ